MKWIYRLSSVVILMAALSLPFYADYRSGGKFLNLNSLPERLMSFFKPSKATINENPAGNAEETASNLENSGSVTVYKWQDSQGQWHFSDQAPEVQSEKTQIDPNQLPTISGMDQQLIEKSANPNGAPEPSFNAELSLDNATKVFDNAQQAAQLMEQRNETLRQIVGEKSGSE